MITALIGFVILFALCFAGVPLAIGLLSVGVVGFASVRGFEAAGSVVGQQITDAFSSYGFSVIPLFVLMGAFIHRAGLADDLFDSARAWLGHIRGGMAHATIGASAAFSAVCGSSIATAATMSRVSLPQMKRHDYDDGFACGAVAAGGTLGILIPPSVPLVIFGILTETDITGLFMAALIPGLLLAFLYMCAAWLVVLWRPSLGQPARRANWRERLATMRRTATVGLLFLIVLGGMYLGVFTPTEAAGIGAAGALIIMILRKAASWSALRGALTEAVLTTASLLLVVGSALVFNTFLTISGLTAELVTLIETLSIPPLAVIAVICGVYLLLGCVFDSLAAMILTAPVFTPIAIGLGYDPLWFGVVVVIVVELGLITPPLGMNVFIVKNLAPHVSVWRIFAGVSPFVAANIAGLILVIVAPVMALWLPRLLN
ncbi:TRAP transporter large permease [Oceanibacterium hippocampi]|uniref:TRAP transporter large permease protein n=1 Tax=Oceanibacterium hippocampi TaxID=745714 RepID=A0A1Y5TXZ2_9PROT|nr:TRAP transporter large permease [Oceanibacterium hippocampi]SLN76573.1 Sialic acid TRAP transporter permease protein SiaT [Oceanibacterium hippocampi]